MERSTHHNGRDTHNDGNTREREEHLLYYNHILSGPLRLFKPPIGLDGFLIRCEQRAPWTGGPQGDPQHQRIVDPQPLSSKPERQVTEETLILLI
jgi:hypothetical protein